MKTAGFPVTHTLDRFDFTAIPSLNKQKVLNLAQGEFVAQKEMSACAATQVQGRRTSLQPRGRAPAAKATGFASERVPDWFRSYWRPDTSTGWRSSG